MCYQDTRCRESRLQGLRVGSVIHSLNNYQAIVLLKNKFLRLTCPAGDNPGAEIIQHVVQDRWGIFIVPEQTVGGKGVAIVAEISFTILAQQILLCSGDGSPGSPLYEVDVIQLLPTSKLCTLKSKW